MTVSHLRNRLRLWRGRLPGSRPSPADRAPVQTRAEILTEAADWAITGWPGPRWEVPRPTAESVRAEALMRAGIVVSEEEAAAALAARLRYRGYAP